MTGAGDDSAGRDVRPPDPWRRLRRALRGMALRGLAGHFGDGVLRPADMAAGLIGAVVKDPVQDQAVWTEYLETVVKERADWKDLYRAFRELN